MGDIGDDKRDHYNSNDHNEFEDKCKGEDTI